MASLPIASREAFCALISDRLSHEGHRIEVQPGQHLIDDLGADSLVVLEYGMALRELGFDVDLDRFDRALLDVSTAYDRFVGLHVRAHGSEPIPV